MKGHNKHGAAALLRAQHPPCALRWLSMLRVTKHGGAGVCWVIDACCLFCLCFTGSCCHYLVAIALQQSLIPDLSSWFPVEGSLPATTSLLHHPCLMCIRPHELLFIS